MELEWTGWDLNPGLPACKAGDLPLIYRPRRAHSVAAGLAVVTAAAEGGPRSPVVPASAWIVSVLLGIVWARLDPLGPGHAFLSGYAAIAAFGTGIGILRRQLWAWPVALASVVGFGPIVLVLAVQLSPASIAAGFTLFVLDSVALLAIHRSYFEPR